jgi:hypothetical protein
MKSSYWERTGRTAPTIASVPEAMTVEIVDESERGVATGWLQGELSP